MCKAATVVIALLLCSNHSANAEQLVLYLGGGGKDAAAALDGLSRPRGALDGALAKAIQFPDKSPRIVKSDSLFGPTSATDIVAFGACDRDAAMAWVKLLKRLGVDGVQARALKGPAALACPGFDEAKLKRLTILQKPLPGDDGVVMLLQGTDLLSINGRQQALSLYRREGILMDVWAPPPPKDDVDCVASIDRQLGLLQTDCAEHEDGDNCFVTRRIGYALTVVAGVLKARPSKPRQVKRECAE